MEEEQIIKTYYIQKKKVPVENNETTGKDLITDTFWRVEGLSQPLQMTPSKVTGKIIVEK